MLMRHKYRVFVLEAPLDEDALNRYEAQGLELVSETAWRRSPRFITVHWRYIFRYVQL